MESEDDQIVSSEAFTTVAASNDAKRAVLSIIEIIDDDILDAFTKRIYKAREVYKKGIGSADSAQELDAVDARAQREICDILNRIRNRNKGKLPKSGYLRKLWKQFGCKKSF